jgi:hypothetical protein
MEKLLSQNGLDRVYKAKLRQYGNSSVEELRFNNKSSAGRSSLPSIFLCHSHLDKTIVNKMLALFDQLNVSAYVDWMDTDMPNETSHVTASLIKQKIERCDKFIFLATYRALTSKWCSWELGLAFSLKKDKDFAILPIESRNGNWPGNEYLGLYPSMYINANIEPELMQVEDITISRDGQTTSLKEWLLN